MITQTQPLTMTSLGDGIYSDDEDQGLENEEDEYPGQREEDPLMSPPEGDSDIEEEAM